MSQLRVYELAKELRCENPTMVQIVIKLGIEIKNHMSKISDEDASKVRRFLQHSQVESTGRVVQPGIVISSDRVVGKAATSSPSVAIAYAPSSAPSTNPVGLPPETPRPQHYPPVARPKAPAGRAPTKTIDATHGTLWSDLLRQSNSGEPAIRRMATLDAAEELRRELAGSGIPGKSVMLMLLALPKYFELSALELSEAITAYQKRNNATHDRWMPDTDQAAAIVRAFLAIVIKLREGRRV